jgi:hypothetical protein
MKKSLLLSLLIPLLWSGVAFSQNNTGSGLKLLEIEPSASEMARAGTRFAVPNGAASIFSNPALLTLDRNSSINLSYTNWLLDSNNLFGGINLRKGKRAVAFAFYTAGDDGFEQRDQPGESNGNFSISYLAISGAFSYDFDYFTAGISGHYLNEDIYLYRANGYAVNLGLASSLFNDRVTIGTSVINLGEMEEINQQATELPSSFNIGISADLFEFVHAKKEDLPILVSVMADFVSPFDAQSSNNGYTDFNPDENYFNFGMTLQVSGVVEVSGGYKTGDNTRPLSFGLGVITEKVNFNYALVPFNTGFGTVHSVGIQYQL